MNDEFIWWLGTLVMYMQEEHLVNLIEINNKVGPEVLEYFWAHYRAGNEPKQDADILIEEAAKSS